MKFSEVSKVKNNIATEVPNVPKPVDLLNAQCVFDEGEAL